MTWKITHSGWTSPVGEAQFDHEHRETGGIIWDRWTTPKLRFSHTSSLFILQGLALQRLFDDVSLVTPNNTEYIGPFLLLRGELEELWRVPLHLSKVTLAHPMVTPEGMKKEEILAKLIEIELGT